MRSGDELQLQLVEEYRERLAKKQQEQKKRQQEQQQERLLWCACHRTGMQSCRVAIANGQITIESLLRAFPQKKAEKAARLNVSEDRERERERRQKDREY